MRIDVTATDAYLRLARMHDAAGQRDSALTMLRFKPGQRPDEEEAALLELKILARHGEGGAPPHLLQRFANPDRWGRAARVIAEGFAERSGSEAALAYLREQKLLALNDPRQSQVLAFMVEHLAELGRPREGLTLVEASLDAEPEAAVFHALRGRALVLASDSSDTARAAFERALALDENEPEALAGLARLEAAAGNGEAALSLWERAAAADPEEAMWVHRRAAQLAELGRVEDAESEWLGLLRDRPYDAEAALRVARLRAERDADSEPTLELARRAVRFGGGPEARAFYEKIAPESPVDGEPVEAPAGTGSTPPTG
jgi:tetratricopeptide (TPR) repeat protein